MKLDVKEGEMGSYISEYYAEQWGHWICKLSKELAAKMLEKINLDIIYLINKGFVIVEVNEKDDEVLAIYNHDGVYYLYKLKG